MPGKRLDLKGKRFGRLVILNFEYFDSRRYSCWRAVCDCGKEIVRRGSEIASARTNSCGCYRRDRMREINTKHGLLIRVKHHPLFSSWSGMIGRCYSESNKDYKNYGARGIRVCDEWRNDFSAFVKYIEKNLGRRPRGRSLDRIRNEGPYAPGNVKWSTPKQQTNNRRPHAEWDTARKVQFNGKSLTIPQWADELGMNYYTLHSRIYRRKWPIEKALCAKKNAKLKSLLKEAI